MVARGDGVLIGLVGFMAFVLGFHFPGFVGLTLSGLGFGLVVCAIVLYRFAESPAWTASRPFGKRPWVSLTCPVCGKPLGWVDEVGKWYCPHCEAYLPALQIRIPLEIAR